ncbi:MAG: phosphoenolpyruvate mutase [Fidelibacterota bacterium]|nr:MAG: phosphoenolpyruvate mutase [Candidatus Neomarinimicrobiota bacterium]
MIRQTTQLKHLLQSKELTFLMEAHNGISAKIVEEAGFQGIWGSGLTISASLGVRDNNEASWTQVLEVLEFISDATSLPILLDGDTGYGNFNNARRLIHKLEQRGIAGVCIEDKVFPKTNSFIGGEQQPLADINEFSGKIKACKDSQTDPDFQVVARVEAFIAGWGLDEVLRRAHAYQEAGADAVLIHSKITTADQITRFMKAWDQSCPVVIVPTKYYQTSTATFQDLGISTVIWANHLLRTAVTAMQETAKQIYGKKSLVGVERQVASVDEIFRLQQTDELKEAEKAYLPISESAKAIILAASRGSKFGQLTKDMPKTMLKYDGQSLLERQVEIFRRCRIKDIHVVLGYKADTVEVDGINRIINKPWEKGGIASSLYAAVDKLNGPVIISFGDILFEEQVLNDLLDTTEDIVLAVDVSWTNGRKPEREIDAVLGTMPPSERYGASRCIPLDRIGTDVDHNQAHGEWIGLMKVSSRGTRQIRDFLESYYADRTRQKINTTMVDVIKALKEREIPVHVNYFRGHWLDVDGPEDLAAS